MDNDVSNKTRVQNFLRDLASSGEVAFIPVVYDDHGTAHALHSKPELPQSIEVNETGRTLARDRNYGRSLKSKVIDWTFQLNLGFDCEVLLEDFETMLRNQPTLERDSSRGLKQVSLELTDVDYSHPPREGQGGTKVTYTLDAIIERN